MGSDTQTDFDALTTAAAAWRSSLDGSLEGLSEAITQEVADRIAAITAEEQRVDALIASGMWLFADQAAFPDAATNHGRVVHSHADGAIFYAHGGMWHQVAKEVDLQSTIASLASEASTREAADTTLQANIDAEAATRAADDTVQAIAATLVLEQIPTPSAPRSITLVDGAGPALDCCCSCSWVMPPLFLPTTTYEIAALVTSRWLKRDHRSYER